MTTDIVEFIHNNRDILDMITDLVPIPLFVKDRAGFYIDCNEAFTEFLSIGREEIIGKSAYDLWKKEEADVFVEKDAALFRQGGLQIYETQITSSRGVLHIVQFHKQIFTDASGVVAGFLGAIFDITEKKKLEESLAQLATIDELTSLPNRRDGMAKLEVLHKDSWRKNRPYCIAMIDIDHFKRLNDQYGHVNGDFVLKEFAELTRQTLRGSDVYFRYGGEEFVLALPETDLNEGFMVVERLRKVWGDNQLILPSGQSIHSTVSIGLTQYSAEGSSFEELLKESDKALYDAKHAGRNRTVCVRLE